MYVCDAYVHMGGEGHGGDDAGLSQVWCGSHVSEGGVGEEGGEWGWGGLAIFLRFTVTMTTWGNSGLEQEDIWRILSQVTKGETSIGIYFKEERFIFYLFFLFFYPLPFLLLVG